MHALDRAEHEQLLRVHVLPYFEQKRLTEITRELVKKFVAEKSRTRKIVNEVSVPTFSRNTLKAYCLCSARHPEYRA